MKNFLHIMALLFIFTSCSKTPIKLMTLSSQVPKEGKPESIGSYSGGCIIGAKAMEVNEKNLILMRLSRGRFWGHPDLLEYLRSSARKFHKKTGRKMIVGDLGHGAGGPSIIGHASHQTGLDVDVWFESLPKSKKSLSLAARETKPAKSYLTIGHKDLKREDWGRTERDLLKVLLSSKKVQRIFVNPLIKKEICTHRSSYQLSDNDLRKVRPWWNHDDHFHVRLYCPKDSPECVKQSDPGEGDGCDETLDWWFTEEAVMEKSEFDPVGFYNGVFSTLPKRCQEILK